MLVGASTFYPGMHKRIKIQLDPPPPTHHEIVSWSRGETKRSLHLMVRQKNIYHVI